MRHHIVYQYFIYKWSIVIAENRNKTYSLKIQHHCNCFQFPSKQIIDKHIGKAQELFIAVNEIFINILIRLIDYLH